MRLRPTIILVLTCLIVPPVVQASLAGTVSLVPGATQVPGLTSDSPGTLLSLLAAPWTSSLGNASGVVVSGVFREAGGTLDFYYQVQTNTFATNCGGGVGQPPCDPIAREAGFSFLGFSTSVGYRTDGGSLPGGFFMNGAVVPLTADRNGTGDIVGFSFSPPDSAKIQPGQASFVLAISTNATNFGSGFASIIDGGGTTVISLAPAPDIPEPASLLLLSGGLATYAARRRIRV